MSIGGALSRRLEDGVLGLVVAGESGNVMQLLQNPPQLDDLKANASIREISAGVGQLSGAARDEVDRKLMQPDTGVAVDPQLAKRPLGAGYVVDRTVHSPSF